MRDGPSMSSSSAPADDSASLPSSPCSPVSLSPCPSSPPPHALLGYAEVPSQFGVVVERRPAGLMIAVPPPWWAKAMSRHVVLAVLAVNVLGNAVFAFVKGGAAAWVVPGVM